MLTSMTGYGQQETTIGEVTCKVEIRSLNSKFLDLNLKLPKELSKLENEIRSLIQQELKRGKINLQIEISNQSGNQVVALNDELFKAYYEKYKSLKNSVNASDSDIFRLAIQSPDVMAPRDSGFSIGWSDLKPVLVDSVNACTDFRAQEGNNLEEKLKQYIDTIRKKLNEIDHLDDQRLSNIKARIQKNLEEIKERVQIDENRFEQELIYYIEKIDITEEKVRLARHLDYFGEVMRSKISEGKKLGFISQEIGREINTIGSKANDSDIQLLVVDMKDELEKTKEQLLNIL